jgi:hypothetical protein
LISHTILESASSIPKADALEIATRAWRKHIGNTALVSGFQEAGIWPLSHCQMTARFKKFKSGGLPSTFMLPDWLEAREEIRSEILTLPRQPKKSTKRKRTKVGGKIVELSLLRTIGAEKEAAAKARKKASKKPQRKRAKKTVPDEPLQPTNVTNENDQDLMEIMQSIPFTSFQDALADVLGNEVIAEMEAEDDQAPRVVSL